MSNFKWIRQFMIGLVLLLFILFSIIGYRWSFLGIWVFLSIFSQADNRETIYQFIYHSFLSLTVIMVPYTIGWQYYQLVYMKLLHLVDSLHNHLCGELTLLVQNHIFSLNSLLPPIYWMVWYLCVWGAQNANNK